jgi:hypothetical protein
MRKEKLFQYFKDPELTQPIYNLEFPEPVVAGLEKKEMTVYAKNISPAELYDVEFIPKDPDLKIDKNTDKVNPTETIVLKFIFTPAEDRKEPLNTEFTVTTKGIIRANQTKPL